MATFQTVPATYAIVDRPAKKRHPYCSKCLQEAMRQAPLGPDEKVVPAKPGELCEECKLQA